jgi:environmental stress-induced protein Ves
MPWKNGLGETLEVARSPDGHSLDAFDWRVSVAPVVADGAFSVFPGIERSIVVIEGAGMQLTLADGRTRALRPGEPFTYDGGTAVEGRLIDGPVRDFNVMVRRGRCTGSLMLVTGPLTMAGGGATTVAYVLSGDWQAQADAETGRLEPGASLTTSAAMLQLRPVAPSSRIAVAVLRAA